jgi:hypothetical protein
MTAAAISRPAPGEYAPYYETYIRLVPDGDLIALLEAQIEDTLGLVEGLDDSQGDRAYAPDKWTVKDVLGHLADSERVFCYRALRFARGDAAALPGFDQDDWAREARGASRSMSDLVLELRAVRRATLTFARSLTPELAARAGTANNTRVSVRALLYIIAGHERHHAAVLRERYRLGAGSSPTIA